MTLHFNVASSGAFRRDSEVEPDGVLQSVGIDKENGFVFAVDTMKAFEITKFPQNEFNPDIQVMEDVNIRFAERVCRWTGGGIWPYRPFSFSNRHLFKSLLKKSSLKLIVILLFPIFFLLCLEVIILIVI